MSRLRLISAGLGLLAALLVPAAHAAANPAELQSLRDGAYRTTSQLFMYVILEKAGERRKDVNRLVAGLDTRVAALGDKELSGEWQQLRTVALRDPYQNGEANQLDLYSLEDHATLFAQGIERRMPHDLDRQRKTLYDLAGRMQVMMTIYLRNGADPLGGSNYSGMNRELDPAKLSTEFTTLLQEAARSQPALAPVIAKIKPKWSFLAPRFTDFNQKSVPYLVDLYGRQIIDLLLTTANG